jgi:ribosomal protein S27AE
VRFLIGFVGVLALLVLGVFEQPVEMRCRSCGIDGSVRAHYQGHGKPDRYFCGRCGHENFTT